MTNWNFDYVIPSLLILVIVMGYYFSLPRLPVRLNKVFLAIMVNQGLVIVSDIVSSWADNEYQSLPAWILVILNSLYFMSLFMASYLFFEMTITLLRLSTSENILRKWLVRLPFIIA